MVLIGCCVGMFLCSDIMVLVFVYLWECFEVVCVEGVKLGDDVLQEIVDGFYGFLFDLGMLIFVD